MPYTRILLVLLTISVILPVSAQESVDSASKFIEFDDTPLIEDIVLPDWFKLSFLELDADIEDLVQGKKQGLILYFGQKDCPYCKTHLEKNWRDRGIVSYTREHFDVVAIDVLGQRAVVDVKGRRHASEKAFANSLKTQFTPTLLFYDGTGKEVLRLSGYYPPYQFRAALEYVADRHYRRETLRDYLKRAEGVAGFDESELNTHPSFSSPPYALQRNRFNASQPLIVFFEQASCHACDVLHSGPLADPGIRKQLQGFEVVQLDMDAETAVVTPEGTRSTARAWARDLGLYYAPTLVFYNESGSEIMRVDSVIRFYRLKNLLTYVSSRAYETEPSFQVWRQKTRSRKSRLESGRP
ncbi:MAG: thioredoxin fold domain-containing protein [Gammaproteobacteria bacterium]|nr:thioredoxin fold domain-containing protein [Gammaproteobacteria bacterium]MDH5801409.1 thioredoxin fold domain-containing protein [Gammaproteobacteria bacterium]